MLLKVIIWPTNKENSDMKVHCKKTKKQGNMRKTTNSTSDH